MRHRTSIRPFSRPNAKRRHPSRRLQTEQLESRMLLAANILFLGGNATPSLGTDGAVMTFLQDNYGAENVTYKQSSVTNNTTDLTNVDVLILSSTPSSGDYRGKFHNSAVPILNWEEAVMDSGSGEFGLSSATMTKSVNTTQMTIASAHPITEGLSGTINFATAGAETLGTSSLFTGLTSLGTATNGSITGTSMLFIAETGQPLNPTSGASPAAGRRVMFPMTDNTFSSLTPDGLQLFGNSINWLANVAAAPPEISNLPATEIGAVSVVAAGEVTETGGGTPNVTLYYGDNDGGRDATQWDEAIDLGTQFGQYSHAIEGLTPQTNYYYTSFVDNGTDVAWATASIAFTTTALNPPVVENRPAENITSVRANIGGLVTDTGNDPPEVTIYWGDNDGGVSAGTWDNSIPLGTQAASFATTLSALDPQTTYYYRASAMNATNNLVWAPSTESFITNSVALDDVVMYNDHVAGSLTHTNATSYRANGINTGTLRNFSTGENTGISLLTTGVGINYAGASSFPTEGTDADAIFGGVIDFGAGTGASLEIQAANGDSYTHAFSGLDAQSVYDFAGTAIRGNDAYTNRWTLVTLSGAEAFTTAHSAGVGVITEGLAANQVGLWVGANHNSDQGFVARWTDIDPGADGAFEVIQTQYTGPVPTIVNGSGVADGSKGYGLSAIRLIESFSALAVLQSNPAPGEKLTAAPSQATLSFNLPLDPATIEATDLTVDGMAATNVEIIDANTVRWTLPGGLGAGEHTLQIATDAVSTPDQRAFVGYQSPFVVVVRPFAFNATPANVIATAADIGVNVVSTGFDDPQVTMYWGLGDGGTNPAAWDHVLDLGQVSSGIHRGTISGLTPETSYFYRSLATNLAGDSWAFSTSSLTTTAALSPTLDNVPATDIGAFSASIGGTVTNTGNDPPVVSLYYGVNDGGTDTAAWNQVVELGRQTGSFSTLVTGLSSETTYYYREIGRAHV